MLKDYLFHKQKDFRLYQGDCLKILPLLKDESVDLIITSPPYNNFRNKRVQKSRENYWKRTNINYDSFSDKMTDKDYEDWQLSILDELYRVLKSTGTLAYNHKDRIFNFEVWTPLSFLLKSKFTLRQRIIWDRRGMQACNPVRFYRTFEDIYLLGKSSDFFWNKDCAKYKDIWSITPSKNSGHPCAFPEELVNRLLLSFSEKKSVILDPFAGSGTTVVQALAYKRRAIGIEISKKYCNLIKKNIKPPSLF